MTQTGIQPWMHRPKIDVIELARLGMFTFTGESVSCNDHVSGWFTGLQVMPYFLRLGKYLFNLTRIGCILFICTQCNTLCSLLLAADFTKPF